MSALAGFPGGTAVSRVRVYDWPTTDGLHGGSPHLHTASTEGYVVIGGHGTLQTLSGDGYGEHPLTPGTALWFTPGTVHRLVNEGDLEIMVVMSNAGLPEAGDAVFTFPLETLGDPDAYAAAAAMPDTTDEQELATAARRRRDLAIDGFLTLRDRVRTEGPEALAPLHRAAAELVAHRVPQWRGIWRSGPLANTVDTGSQLEALAGGHGGRLAQSTVRTSPAPTPRYGMCGHVTRWAVDAVH